MGKKYLDTKEGSLEQSVLGVWQTAIDESDARMDGRTKEYREHRKKLESARLRREKKNLNKEEVELDETNKNDKSDDGEGMDAVQPKAIKKKFKDRKDKDIDNDGDVDSSDKYLHKRRKAVAKAISKQEEVELDEASVMVDLENDNKKLMSDIKKMGIKVKDLGDSGNPGYNEYKLTGSPAALKKGGKKFGWDQQTEEVDLDEGKMNQMHQMMKDGKTAAQIAKALKLDLKTVKALMDSYNKMVPESFEIGTEKYLKHTVETTPGQKEWTETVTKKASSMRETLAKVWEADVGKSPFQKNAKEDLTKGVKGGKTMTGKKVAAIDTKPTIKEKKK